MPIHEGQVDGDVVECPYHNWRFDLRSGDLLTSYGPERGITSYEVREIDGLIEVWLSAPSHEAAG
jgi:nitrite reductase/ring-hydroxylating ferredoxin subunit